MRAARDWNQPEFHPAGAQVLHSEYGATVWRPFEGAGHEAFRRRDAKQLTRLASSNRHCHETGRLRGRIEACDAEAVSPIRREPRSPQPAQLLVDDSLRSRREVPLEQPVDTTEIHLPGVRGPPREPAEPVIEHGRRLARPHIDLKD